MDDLFKQLSSVISDWDTLGTLAGMIAAINLLVNALKLDGLKNKIPKRALPFIALGLGVAGGFLSALASGASIIRAVIQGMMLGLGAIGTHEVITQSLPVKKDDKPPTDVPPADVLTPPGGTQPVEKV